MDKRFIGIEIGGTKLQLIITDKELNIIERFRKQIDAKKQAGTIKATIYNILVQLIKHHRITSIGVGFGGPVNVQNGSIITSYHVKGWRNFRLSQWLYEIVGSKTRIENDANCAAYAEANIGSGKKYNKIFYVTLGSGVGGGYIMDKEIYHGMLPGESEIGHLRYDKYGTILEAKCSGWAVDNKICNYISKFPESIMAKLINKDNKSEAKYLLPAIKNGDAGAEAILQETAEDLAYGLSHVIHLLHPEVIILGGGLSLIGEPLRKAVENYLPGFLMSAFPAPVVKIAKLKEDVVIKGAALLAKNMNL